MSSSLTRTLTLLGPVITTPGIRPHEIRIALQEAPWTGGRPVQLGQVLGALAACVSLDTPHGEKGEGEPSVERGPAEGRGQAWRRAAGPGACVHTRQPLPEQQPQREGCRGSELGRGAWAGSSPSALGLTPTTPLPFQGVSGLRPPLVPGSSASFVAWWHPGQTQWLLVMVRLTQCRETPSQRLPGWAEATTAASSLSCLLPVLGWGPREAPAASGVGGAQASH